MITANSTKNNNVRTTNKNYDIDHTQNKINGDSFNNTINTSFMKDSNILNDTAQSNNSTLPARNFILKYK